MTLTSLLISSVTHGCLISGSSLAFKQSNNVNLDQVYRHLRRHVSRALLRLTPTPSFLFAQLHNKTSWFPFEDQWAVLKWLWLSIWGNRFIQSHVLRGTISSSLFKKEQHCQHSHIHPWLEMAFLSIDIVQIPCRGSSFSWFITPSSAQYCWAPAASVWMPFTGNNGPPLSQCSNLPPFFFTAEKLRGHLAHVKEKRGVWSPGSTTERVGATSPALLQRTDNWLGRSLEAFDKVSNALRCLQLCEQHVVCARICQHKALF